MAAYLIDPEGDVSENKKTEALADDKVRELVKRAISTWVRVVKKAKSSYVRITIKNVCVRHLKKPFPNFCYIGYATYLK